MAARCSPKIREQSFCFLSSLILFLKTLPLGAKIFTFLEKAGPPGTHDRSKGSSEIKAADFTHHWVTVTRASPECQADHCIRGRAAAVPASPVTAR